jgi:hypothetical protein
MVSDTGPALVITTRIAGYEDTPVRSMLRAPVRDGIPAPAVELRLAPLEDDAIEDFSRMWHAALAEGRGDATAFVGELATRRRENDEVDRMARNPLTLTALLVRGEVKSASPGR